jgi:hypothetical protein
MLLTFGVFLQLLSLRPLAFPIKAGLAFTACGVARWSISVAKVKGAVWVHEARVTWGNATIYDKYST